MLRSFARVASAYWRCTPKMAFQPPLQNGAPNEFRELFMWDELTGKFDIPMAASWFLLSENYLKIVNRLRLTGSVVTQGTPVTLYTGAYTALSLMVHNPTSNAQTWLIYDGATCLVGAAGVAIAAGVLFEKDLWWMPFATSVRIDASSALVVFTMGGYHL